MAKKKTSEDVAASHPVVGAPPSSEPVTETGARAESPASAAGTEGKAQRKPWQWALWFRTTVIVLFGLLYAWDLFEAISNLFGKLEERARINEVRLLNGFAPLDTPWVFLLANLALPIVVFGVAILIARKRNVGILAMILLAGLGVVAAISLTITAFVLQLP